MLHQYRITKYDPKFRDDRGAYTKGDWTSFSDVGGKFGGVILSKEEYLHTESAYIGVAMRFLVEDNVPALYARDVENRFNSGHAPAKGSLISNNQLPAICRAVLREEFWCKLEAGGRFLHFGYDYYMYIGVKRRCEASIEAAHKLGLYVEQFDSPHLESRN